MRQEWYRFFKTETDIIEKKIFEVGALARLAVL